MQHRILILGSFFALVTGAFSQSLEIHIQLAGGDAVTLSSEQIQRIEFGALPVGGADTQGPEILTTCLESTGSEDARSVEATLSDPAGVATAYLFYSLNGAAYEGSLMSTADGSQWAGTLPGVAAGGEVQYYIHALDASAARNIANSETCVYSIAGELDAPMLSIELLSSGIIQLQWTVVDGASSYNVYEAQEFGGTETLLLTQSGTETQLSSFGDGLRFYRVTAAN